MGLCGGEVAGYRPVAFRGEVGENTRDVGGLPRWEEGLLPGDEGLNPEDELKVGDERLWEGDGETEAEVSTTSLRPSPSSGPGLTGDLFRRACTGLPLGSCAAPKDPLPVLARSVWCPEGPLDCAKAWDEGGSGGSPKEVPLAIFPLPDALEGAPEPFIPPPNACCCCPRICACCACFC